METAYRYLQLVGDRTWGAPFGSEFHDPLLNVVG